MILFIYLNILHFSLPVAENPLRFCKITHLIPLVWSYTWRPGSLSTCSPSQPHQPYNDNSKRRSSFNYLYPKLDRSRLTCINPSNPSRLPCSSKRKRCIYHTPRKHVRQTMSMPNFFWLFEKCGCCQMGHSIQQLAREDGMLLKTSSSECLIDKMFVSAGTTL